MRKVILIGGDLASGKSTLSQLIAKRFNISTFNKDILKEIFAEDIITHNREENIKLSIASFKIFKYIISQGVSPLILESNFKKKEMEELIPLLKANDYEALSLKLHGDFEVEHKRFLERWNKNRNPIHKSVNLTNIEDFILVNTFYREAMYPGKVIEIDATSFDYQNDESLYCEVEKFLKG